MAFDASSAHHSIQSTVTTNHSIRDNSIVSHDIGSAVTITSDTPKSNLVNKTNLAADRKKSSLADDFSSLDIKSVKLAKRAVEDFDFFADMTPKFQSNVKDDMKGSGGGKSSGTPAGKI